MILLHRWGLAPRLMEFSRALEFCHPEAAVLWDRDAAPHVGRLRIRGVWQSNFSEWIPREYCEVLFESTATFWRLVQDDDRQRLVWVRVRDEEGYNTSDFEDFRSRNSLRRP